MDSKTTREMHLERIKMWNTSMQNHERYMNHESGFFDEKYVERRSCPVCGNEEHGLLFKKSGGQYVRCKKCDMIFLNPVFKDIYVDEYYKINNGEQSKVVESDSEFYDGLYFGGLGVIEENKAGIKDRNILDVGCSSGRFLDCAKKKEWSVYGIEPNVTEKENALKKGHIVFDNISEVENMKFSVITLWDVFEHVKNGREFLNSCSRLLNDGGLIFMQMPNSMSLAARILQQKCNVFDGLEHVNLYNKNCIEIIAKNSGLEIIYYKTVIDEIGVINNYMLFDDPYLGHSKNSNNIFDAINKEFILKNDLGYKMQVLFRKY